MQRYLQLLVTNVDLRSKLSMRSREVAMSEYSYRRVAERYEELFRELGSISQGMVPGVRAARLANQPLDLAFSLESIRNFVSEKATDLRSAFDLNPEKARQILASHIERLLLTPREGEDGPVYDVSGNIDLFGRDRTAMGLAVKASPSRQPGGKKSVMLMVARESFEPPRNQ